jgi:hypothetical protein
MKEVEGAGSDTADSTFGSFRYANIPPSRPSQSARRMRHPRFRVGKEHRSRGRLGHRRMNGRKNPGISIWRRRIGAISTVLGFLLFAAICFVYLRYASNPSSLHVEERLRHVRALGLTWSVSFYGSILLFIVSLSALGWSRWSGLLVNGGAFLCALMTLGAMCGPFGCT